MGEVDYLALAVPLGYKYNSKGQVQVSEDYNNAVAACDALYGHSRMRLPYGLFLFGY